jgi:diacylglycerol O-acyltransferase
MPSPFPRLTAADLVNLRIEDEDTPAHIGALILLEAAPLVDAAGRLRLDEIQSRLDSRLSRVPELRRVIHRPGFLRGGTLWMDEPDFDIGRHVREAPVGAPGGQAELMATTSRLFDLLLDRSQPLWELWFMTGLAGGRLAALLKLHHVIADGLAAVSIMSSFFDLEPDAADPIAAAWNPQPLPRAWPLFLDGLATKAATATRMPRSLVEMVADIRWTAKQRSAAPPTSLNRPVKAGRTVRFVRLDLAAAKAHAHSAGGKVNDVVLDLAAGGLRALLLQRGEPVAGLRLIVSMPVSLRARDETLSRGNQTGIASVPLPVGEADPRLRLEAIVAATRAAKAQQHPAHTQALFSWLAATPLLKPMIARQHMVNTFVTNVPGPPVPLYFLGARILDVVPITQVAGNATVVFCAFSYAGRLYMVVTADATACPDVDAVVSGIERTWKDLQEGGRLTAAAV